MNKKTVPLFGSFIIGLAVVLGGPANLFACVGFACRQDCNPTCGLMYCGNALSGECECTIKIKNHFRFCMTSGGSCETGCTGGDPPEVLTFGPAYQDFSFLGLKAAIAAEKQSALTERKYDSYYGLVAPVLEFFRGPQGFEIGHSQSDVMISRSLPNQFLKDGSEASEPAQSVSVSLEVGTDRMIVELRFTEGVTVSGEVLDGGSSGVLRIMKAGQGLSVVSW